MARVLIIEDDRPFADALAYAFRPEGHEVLVAATADEGIQLGLAHRPDVIIADWMLRSDLHGGDVCQRIYDACPLVKAIIITGCSEVVSQAAQCSPCVAAIVEKPFHTEEIIGAVRLALSDASEAKPWIYQRLLPASAAG
jgi:DNA-binding response OmpR family regulator